MSTATEKSHWRLRRWTCHAIEVGSSKRLMIRIATTVMTNIHWSKSVSHQAQAPIFRSLAAIDTPGDATTYTVFADGGMWANSPVLVALIEALGMTEAKRPIEIYCLGTCPLPAGEQISKGAVHRGLLQWRFGADAASLSVDIQEFAFDRMARMLASHVACECTIIRFPRDEVPAAMMQYLDLDETDQKPRIA